MSKTQRDDRRRSGAETDEGQAGLGAASLQVSGSGLDKIRECFENPEFSAHFKALGSLDLRNNTTIPTLCKGCSDLFSMREGPQLNAAIQST